MEIAEDTDLSKLDRGNELVVDEAAAAKAADEAAAKAAADEKASEEAEALAAKAKADAEAKAAEDAKTTEERERDEQGRFTKKEPSIPKARFDEAVEKERAGRLAAEARAADLEAKIAAAAHGADVEKLEAEITELEKTHTKYILQGEADKAIEVMRDIRKKERAVIEANFAAKDAERNKQSAAERAAAEEVERVNAEVAELMKIPELDENNEKFNPTLVNLVLAEQARLINDEKLSPSAALRKAGASVTEAANLNRTLSDASTEKKDTKAEERKAEATKKALAAAGAQPASMKEAGLDSDKAGGNKATAEDVMKMSQEEFAALPEATKAKLRGDVL